LHAQAERQRLAVVLDRHGFEMLDEGRAAIPGRAGGGRGDVVAVPRRNRDRHEGRDADLVRKGIILGDDAVEDLRREGHEVHLVDGDHEVADADQRGEIAVAPRLRLHAVAGVDENDRDVGGRRAGDHVARVLGMARRVGDDELASAGREIAVGDVDGDALLALGRKTVDQQGKVDPGAVDVLPPGRRLHGRELALADQLGIVEQAADERALAVVDVAAGNEAQESLALGGREILLQAALDRPHERAGIERAHQKYPSCFFLSIEAVAS